MDTIDTITLEQYLDGADDVRYEMSLIIDDRDLFVMERGKIVRMEQNWRIGKLAISRTTLETEGICAGTEWMAFGFGPVRLVIWR